MSETHDLLPLVRKKVGEFLYPYGAFPDDEFEQHEGYEVEYRGQEEEGPEDERYRTEVLVSAEKLIPLFLDLCWLLPPKVYVSLERASADMYRQWDEFVSDEVRRETFVDLFTTHQFIFTEDGNLGLGAFSQDPPLEIFLGSHKELVVFSPALEPVTEILHKHGLESRELECFYKRDHSHLALVDYRGMRGPQFDFLHVADAVRHALDMQLQQDDEENVDEDGKPLGLVAWHAVAIVTSLHRARARRRTNRVFLQEFGLTAGNGRGARELLEQRLERDGYRLLGLEELFRIDLRSLPNHVQPPVESLERPGIWYVGRKTETDDHPLH